MDMQVFLDRYRIVSLLGRGAKAEVYLADDLRRRLPVALKFIVDRSAGELRARLRIYDGALLALPIAHPNVCRVYDVGEVGGRLFLSMEYVAGESLRDLLRRRGRLPVDETIRLGDQIARGLAAAHDVGVLHGDLKPANVLVDGGGRPHVTDFGLAGSVSGSDPIYRAPERTRQATVSSDLYSLGLVLYEMVTGRRATARSSRPSRRPSVPLSRRLRGLDPSIERLILECLEEDPDRRPASAMAVATALRVVALAADGQDRSRTAGDDLSR